MTTTRHRQPRRPAAPRVVAYLRVSTAEQGDKRNGLDGQRADITAACQARGWTVTRWVEDVVSGKDSGVRPALLGLMDELDQGVLDVLVVAKLDRLSRDLHDSSGIVLKRAVKHGWSVVALDVDADTTTASGMLYTGLMMAFAQSERMRISERTRAGMAAVKARGQHVGRPPQMPAAVVARVVDERRAGLTLQAIADGLTADAVPTVGGGPWRTSTVQAALRRAQGEAERAALAAGNA